MNSLTLRKEVRVLLPAFSLGIRTWNDTKKLMSENDHEISITLRFVQASTTCRQRPVAMCCR
jgi:hypothetical protein